MEINATILVSAISFLVFIFIMNKILYQPVMDIMQKREEYIKANKEEAKKHNENAQSLIKEKDEKIADAQRKSRDIVATKAESLKEEKTRVVNDAKNVTGSYFEHQKQSLASQEQQLKHNMKYDVADLANNLTTKLMGFGVAFDPLNEQEIEEVMKKNV